MPPIPFPPTVNVPLVGQPCTVKGWFPSVLIHCNCEAKEPMMIVGLGGVAQCPACGRGFTVTEIHHDARTGDGRVGISQVVVNPPAEAIAQNGGRQP